MKILNIIESLDSNVSYHWIKRDDRDWDGQFKIGDNGYTVNISKYLSSFINFAGSSGGPYWLITFESDESSYDLTNKRESFKVFSTVIKMVEEFVNAVEPEQLVFSADKMTKEGGETSRVSLYHKMATKIGGSHGYTVRRKDEGDSVRFWLEKK